MVGVFSLFVSRLLLSRKNFSSEFATLHLVFADRPDNEPSLSHAASRQKKNPRWLKILLFSPLPKGKDTKGERKARIRARTKVAIKARAKAKVIPLLGFPVDFCVILGVYSCHFNTETFYIDRNLVSAGRRATARTTTFVEPCSRQKKTVPLLGFVPSCCRCFTWSRPWRAFGGSSLLCRGTGWASTSIDNL